MNSFSVYQYPQDIYRLNISKIPEAIDRFYGESFLEFENDPLKWRDSVVSRIVNPQDYVENKIEIMSAVKERWIEWKNMHHSSSDRELTRELENKLEQCQVYLDMMIKALV